MRFDVITLFPDMFSLLAEQGVTGRAHLKELWALRTWNPRDYTSDVHRTVDDRPYGGGLAWSCWLLRLMPRLMRRF